MKDIQEHEILKKVDPAPWKEVPLVLNNRSLNGLRTKFAESLSLKLLPGGGGALLLHFVSQFYWMGLVYWFPLVLVSGVTTTRSTGVGPSLTLFSGSE